MLLTGYLEQLKIIFEFFTGDDTIGFIHIGRAALCRIFAGAKWDDREEMSTVTTECPRMEL